MSRPRQPPSLVLLAGWLFADVLVALMVVFLAAIPGAPPKPVSVPRPTAAPTPTATPSPPPTISQQKVVIDLTTSTPALQSDAGERDRVRHTIGEQLQNQGMAGRRAGIVLTFGTDRTTSSGNTLAQTVNDLVLRVSLPETFGSAALDAFHQRADNDPAAWGQVELWIYFFVP
jgi:hypothetical protein